jgi:Hemagglutinin repeat
MKSLAVLAHILIALCLCPLLPLPATAASDTGTYKQNSHLAQATPGLQAINFAVSQASQVLADQNIDITAGRNVQLLQATDTQSSSNVSQSSSSSLQLQVGLAPKQTAFSKNSADGNGNGTSTTAVTSVLSANNGNLTITAGTDKQYQGTGQGNLITQGADLLAKGDVNIEANRVDLGAAQGDSTSMSHSSTSSLSVGAALAGTVGSLITQAYDQAQAAKDGTGNSRLDGAMALKSGYDSYKLIDGGAKSAMATADAGPANGTGSAFGISASINSSHSESKSADHTSTQRGTNIQAGNLNITARETDINAQGAKLQAENISLDAKRDINLGAASNSSNTQSSNSNSSAGVGVTVGLGQQNGISFQVGASTGHGNANGSETSYDNTLVTASNKLSIKSGNDTNLKGAQLAGKQVTTDIGGNLNIETLQDQSSYTSKQESGGFGVSLCIPPICYGTVATVSVNAAQQAIDHNYQSATGQSGIAAGADGFDIKVKGNTDLKGGAITSSADKSKNSLQTASLTYSDLENKQDTSASSYSISVGNSTSALSQAGTNLTANLAGQAGLPENGSQRSSTQSVISPANITLTGTGDATKDAQSQTNANTLTTRDASKANQSLKNTLTLQDAAKVQADLKTAQQNQQAAQLVGAVMDNMIGDLAANKQWKEGSTEKVLLHGLSGAIQASIAGGSLATGTAAGAVNEKLIPVMVDYLEKNGVPQYVKDNKGNDIPNPQFGDLMKIGSTLVGAGVGAAAGGGKAGNVALGASVGLNGTTNNFMQHQAKFKANVNACKSNPSSAGCGDYAAMTNGTPKAIGKVAGYDVSAIVGSDGKPVSYTVGTGDNAMVMQPTDYAAFTKMPAGQQQQLMTQYTQAQLNDTSISNSGFNLKEQVSNAKLIVSCPAGDCNAAQAVLQGAAGTVASAAGATKEFALTVVDLAGKSSAIQADAELGTDNAKDYKPLSAIGKSINDKGISATTSDIVDGIKQLPSNTVDAASKGNYYDTTKNLMDTALVVDGATSVVKAGVGVVKDAVQANAAAAADAAAIAKTKVDLNARRDDNLTTGLVPADSINKLFTDNGYTPPFTAGTHVNVDVAKPNTSANMVVSPGQVQAIADGKPAVGAFSTPDSVTSVADVRTNLAVTDTMKPGTDLLIQPVATTGKPMVIVEGQIGPQEPSTQYPGGGNQTFYDYPAGATRTDYVKPVGNAQPLPQTAPATPVSTENVPAYNSQSIVTAGANGATSVPSGTSTPANSANAGVGLRNDLSIQAGVPTSTTNVWGASLDDLKQAFNTGGATITPGSARASSSGNSQILNVEGSSTGVVQVQYSPASAQSSHGGQYYKFTYVDGAELKVIDPATYRVLGWPENGGKTTFQNPSGKVITYDPVSKTWR